MNSLVQQFQACRTDAEIYRLSIVIENEAPPGDIIALYEQIGALPEAAARWLDNLSRMIAREVTVLQPFRRLPKAPNVCLYSTRQSPEEPRDLIIAFCGLANRLQLPTAVFCQHLDGSQFDILLVRDPSKRIYIEGIPGYAPSLALVADRFRRELDLDAYGSVYCLGTSGGGWAALMTGDMLKARRAISIAGKPPALTPKLQHVWTSTGGPTADVDFGVFERYFAETAARFTPMIALFGADNPADREGSIAIQRITGAKAIGLMGIADHNLMFELLNRRCLARVLRHYLLENLGDNTQLTGETPPPIETRATEAAKQDL